MLTLTRIFQSSLSHTRLHLSHNVTAKKKYGTRKIDHYEKALGGGGEVRVSGKRKPRLPCRVQGPNHGVGDLSQKLKFFCV